MIGYIQDSNNADYWLAKINQWITELTNTKTGLWCEDDGLNKYNSNKCDRFLSSHKRMNKTIMTLHHYWIKL